MIWFYKDNKTKRLNALVVLWSCSLVDFIFSAVVAVVSAFLPISFGN